MITPPWWGIITGWQQRYKTRLSLRGLGPHSTVYVFFSSFNCGLAVSKIMVELDGIVRSRDL